MTTDFRALCADLLWALENAIRVIYHEDGTKHISTANPIVNRARAALGEADEPAVPEGREPASVTGQPNWRGLCEELVDAWLKGDDIVSAMNRARAVLARWGTSNLTQTRLSPADGEVAELVAELQSMATDADRRCRFSNAERLSRAAELLQRLSPPQPVPVSERLPGPSVKVLAHYFNGLGKGRTICAIWVPAKTRSDSYGDDDFTEYDEESDTFYWPEGWYEAIENWDDLGYVKVDEGEVIYWQPIPKWPAHALPLPEVGE